MSFFRRRRAILDSILRNLINIGLGAAGLPGILYMIKLQVLGFSMDTYLVLMKKRVDTSLTFMIISMRK
jgi:hypothetical protein